MSISNEVKDALASSREIIIQWRRYLHEHPELSYEEVNTSQFIYDLLKSFNGLEVTRPTKTSVMARLICENPGRVLAIRADIDALQIDEQTELSFSSKNPGVMHACGHDGHTAILLGAAQLLSEMQSQLTGEIRFIFQHAEEVFPGGAKELVEAGVLRGVDEIIGLHLFTMLPVGKIGICSGPFTANDDVFDIEIIGKGGHAAQPEQTVDPIVIGAQVVSNLQNIVSRNLTPFKEAVISITEFHGGSAKNIIPNSIKLGGGVRSFDSIVRKKIEDRIEQIIKGVTTANESTYTFNYQKGYDSVYNDPHLTSRIEEIVKENFGIEYLLQMKPLMLGEDFSGYLKNIPGCFVGIGAAFQNEKLNFPHHHPQFDIDESSLEIGLKYVVTTALSLQKTRN